MLPMSTVPLPATTTSGGPVQVSLSPTRSAGIPPMSTVGLPGGRAGPPTCGTTPVTMGQTCMSLTRAAGGISRHSLVDHDHRALDGERAARRDLCLARSLHLQSDGGLHLDIAGFGFQVGLRLDAHGLDARERDAVLVHG